MRNRLTPLVVIGLIVTGIWIIGAATYFLAVPGALFTTFSSFGHFISVLFSLLVPLAVLWTAVLGGQALVDLKTETHLLKDELKVLKRQKNLRNGSISAETEAWIARKISDMSAIAEQTEARLNELTVSTYEAIGKEPPARNVALPNAKVKEDKKQRPLALEVTEEPPVKPLTMREYVRALNFPDSATDTEGLRLMKKAMDDPSAGRLMRSAQDVLELLSEAGLFMNELKPEQPSVAMWRKFASQQRGLPISAMAGIRDEEVIEKARTKFQNDPVFRDVAHHFLRQFDQALREFVERAEDFEVAELGKTRSARAFMLLGQLTGAFGPA